MADNRSGDAAQVAKPNFMTCCLCRCKSVPKSLTVPDIKKSPITPEEKSDPSACKKKKEEATSKQGGATAPKTLKKAKVVAKVPTHNPFTTLPIQQGFSSDDESSDVSTDDDIYHDVKTHNPLALNPDFQEVTAAYLELSCLRKKILKFQKKYPQDEELHSLLAENHGLIMKIRSHATMICRKEMDCALKLVCHRKLPIQVRLLLPTHSNRIGIDEAATSF